MLRKRYRPSVSRRSIDENNESVIRSWIVFCHGIVAKLTSAAEFSDEVMKRQNSGVTLGWKRNELNEVVGP